MARFFRNLGARIKALRIKQSLSQADLAEKADIGLRHYQDLEAGHIVSLRMLWAIARALKTSISNLTKDIE